ncbi:hypothetical protein B0H10DRAFT_2236042 [Mycena sp. CBHHK59/15]|nr:hypothetical protein B0H10DRAFT_2236042 [Mycena sp. CBHHK59/15]
MYIPLSASFNSELETSALAVDWVLSSGVPASHSVAHGLLSLPCSDGSSRSMNVQLAVTASLRSDLVLGRDWMSYCRDAFPNARFLLHSGSIHIHPFPIPSSAPVPNAYESAMEVDPPNDPPFTCAYLSPTRRLSSELLSEMFLWCFDGHPCCGWVLSAVCAKWRRQALNIPLIRSKIRLLTNQSSSPPTPA